MDDSQHVVQVCHGYDGPFLDCANQYAALFSNTPWRVTTVFLSGEYDDDIAKRTLADEVFFFELDASDLSGLKIKAIMRLRALASTKKYRLCIAHRHKSMYSALLATSLPVIGVHHALGDYKRFARRIFAFLSQSRLDLWGVSNFIRDDIRSSLPSWPKEKIQTFYNCIDVSELQSHQINQVESRQHLGLSENAWVVANVGRLHPDKDQTTLCRAFAAALPSLPDHALLFIAGAGKLQKKLSNLVGELGIAHRVHWAGQVSDIKFYFKAFNLFVLSSDGEPFGMVLLEAMSAGIPILASHSGAAPEILQDDNALFPLGDIKALSQKIITQWNMASKGNSDTIKQNYPQLQRVFSISTARKQFWSMPKVQKYLSCN